MYLDDILIYSEIEAEHEIHVKRVLQKLREVSLQADITKCAFLSRFWHVSTESITGLNVRQRKCCSELSVMT